MRLLPWAAMLLATCAGAASADPASFGAAALASAMRAALLSDGFEVRINVASARATQAAEPVKLEVVGKFEGERQRLLVRAIAPRELHGSAIVAEQTSAGRTQARAYAPGVAGRDVDSSQGVFGTAVHVWDLFQPWWRWPLQGLGPMDRVSGRECRIVRSDNPSGRGEVSAVVSCVDEDAMLALRTELIDRRGKSLRTITVTKLTRRASGQLGAKGLAIVERDGARTDVDTYSADEHHAIDPNTFGPLASVPIR